jgi:hypothetical protein
MIVITSMVQCSNDRRKWGATASRLALIFRFLDLVRLHNQQSKIFARQIMRIQTRRFRKRGPKSHYPFQRTCSIATVSSTNRLLLRLLVTACSRLAQPTGTMEMNCKATELLAEQSLSSTQQRTRHPQNVRWKQGSQRHDVLAKRYFFGVG